MEELIGAKLGQYRIEEKIGQGAMATIFKSYQHSLDRYVAIKVMPPAFAAKNPVFIKRFQREAKSIARLNHPNILPVYDFGIDRDYSYIVMRYVEGAQTLSQVIYRPGAAPNFDLIIQVANALAYAHKHGVIHRDIKPSNILLDDGWALLSDFGVAKVDEFATRLTGTGKSIGTPAYMSPEQARGGLVDHRTDIYALGIILYEMLTDTLPHDADTPLGILLRRTTEPPPPVRTLNPTIPERIEQVVIRALTADPDERFSSAEHFGIALQAAAADQPYQTPAAGIRLDSRATGVLSTADIATEDEPPQPETLANEPAHRLRYAIWLVGIGMSIIIGGVVLWGGNVFSSTASRQLPDPTIQVVAVEPTSTSTPTFTPSPTPTNTPKLSTYTPLPTITSTNMPVLATATPMVLVITATSTLTPTVAPSPTPGLPTNTPTLTLTPSPEIPAGTFVLLNPISLDDPSYGATNFEWEWNEIVTSDMGFEVRVWREGEPLAGAHDAVLDNQQGRVEKIGQNRYRLTIDIRRAAGVRERSGEYLWTVALVQISPAYADLGQQAEPVPLRFEAGGGSSGGSNNNSSSGGGGSSGGID